MDSDDDIPTLIEHDSTPVQTRPSARVPLTIICGFLGAGKSTLLKRILTERHGYRIAVIMNEFGDTADIESKTVNVSSPDDPAAQSEEILELANGCLCCSIKDTGVAAIEKLMQRKGAFDHILLETTGLADPGPIASIFWHNEEFASGLGRDIALDGVICVVDAFFGEQQMEEDHSEDHVGESLKQIAGSDVILLNKTDLVAASKLTQVESLIKLVNPTAPIYHTIRGNVDLGCIMGIGAFTAPPPPSAPSSAAPSPPQSPSPSPSPPPSLALHHHHEDDHDEHIHDHDHDHSREREPTHYELRGISSLQVHCPVLSAAQFARLDEWIRSVLWENRVPEASNTKVDGGAQEATVEKRTKEDNEGKDLLVLRCKGLITTEDGKQYVLQGVRSMYDMSELAGKEDEVEDDKGREDLAVPQVGKIVLIGKGLNEAVRRSLENAIHG